MVHGRCPDNPEPLLLPLPLPLPLLEHALFVKRIDPYTKSVKTNVHSPVQIRPVQPNGTCIRNVQTHCALRQSFFFIWNNICRRLRIHYLLVT